MTPAARIAAAIEIFDDIAARRRPVGDALKDWGLSHRFAGSKDRAAIGTLVYDGLRVKASSAWRMGAETGRAVMLGMLADFRGLEPDDIEALFDGAGYGPTALGDDERARLAAPLPSAPSHVIGNYPDWLDPHFERAFGDRRAAEGRALAARAPLDLRVNTLKGDVETASRAIAQSLGLEPERVALAPNALRLPLRGDGQPVRIDTDPAYLTGLVEIQDAGSQLAALIATARPGERVLDFCAGGGGKTLALAADMAGKGTIYAYDADRRRLAPIHERLTRAGVTNCEIRTPVSGADVLADLEGAMDLVLVDAPCTGTGTWRRNPDAKWRLKLSSLALRLAEQASVLDKAARYVRPGGRLVYITCSVLTEENDDQVDAFLSRTAGFRQVPFGAMLRAADLPTDRREALTKWPSAGGGALQLTPARAATDGFFVSLIDRIG